MGATCNRESLITDSRGSVVQLKTWRKVYLEEFPKTFPPNEEQSVWAKEIFELLKDWDQSAELSFTNMQRWGDFLILDLNSPLLRYTTLSRETNPSGKNMFELLHNDFSDQRNPIGALIACFASHYFSENMDEVQEAIDQRDLEKVPFFLSTLTSTILKFQHLLTKTVLALYSNISILLERKLEDLEGVLLTSLVEGELYRLLERLASVLYIQATDRLKLVVQMSHSVTPDSLGLERKNVTALVELKCREAKDMLLRMASSENLYEKRMLLLAVDKLMREVSPSEGTKRALLAWVVFKSGLYTILPQLHLSKLFFSVAPSVVPLCHQSVQMLVANFEGDCTTEDKQQMGTGSTRDGKTSDSE